MCMRLSYLCRLLNGLYYCFMAQWLPGVVNLGGILGTSLTCHPWIIQFFSNFASLLQSPCLSLHLRIRRSFIQLLWVEFNLSWHYFGSQMVTAFDVGQIDGAAAECWTDQGPSSSLRCFMIFPIWILQLPCTPPNLNSPCFHSQCCKFHKFLLPDAENSVIRTALHLKGVSLCGILSGGVSKHRGSPVLDPRTHPSLSAWTVVSHDPWRLKKTSQPCSSYQFPPSPIPSAQCPHSTPTPSPPVSALMPLDPSCIFVLFIPGFLGLSVVMAEKNCLPLRGRSSTELPFFVKTVQRSSTLKCAAKVHRILPQRERFCSPGSSPVTLH